MSREEGLAYLEPDELDWLRATLSREDLMELNEALMDYEAAVVRLLKAQLHEVEGRVSIVLFDDEILDRAMGSIRDNARDLLDD
jgi:exonuclease VII small subunit